MKFRKKIFTSFLVFTTGLSVLLPGYGAQAAAEVEQALVPQAEPALVSPTSLHNTPQALDADQLKRFYPIDLYISPNGDGKRDTTNLVFEFASPQYHPMIQIWDKINPTAGKYGNGYLGYIYYKSSLTEGPWSLPFDGTYTSWTAGEGKVKAPDGIYYVDIATFNEAYTEFVIPPQRRGPIFIKTTAPTIQAQSGTTEGSTFELSGKVKDSWIDWKAYVKDDLFANYSVNAMLKAKYELTNSKGENVDGAVDLLLNDDGTFNVNLTGLTSGENKVKIMVDDLVQNSSSLDLTVTKTTPDPDPNNGKLVLNGTPLANITFSVYTAGEKTDWFDFTTDEQGNFPYNLPDGTYNVDGIWVDPTWYPLNGSFTIKHGLVNGTDRLVINAGDYQLPTNPTKFNLTGTLSKNGANFANIPFSFHSLDGSNWYDTRTDANGKFVTLIPDGTYQIDGIWDQTLGQWFVLNQQFTVNDGKLADGEQLTVDVIALTLSGKITRAGIAVPNTTFSIRSETGNWYDATTDANGNYSFILPHGKYEFKGVWIESEKVWLPVSAFVGIFGTTPTTFNLNLPAEPPVNVTGILSKGNQALGHIVFSFHNGDQWYDVTTDNNGRYKAFLPDGTYTVEGIWLPAESKWYSLGSQFTVKNGHLVDQTQFHINLE